MDKSINFYIVRVYQSEEDCNGVNPGIFFDTWDETSNFVYHCIKQGLCVSVAADQED